MLGVTQYLARHGLALGDIGGYVRDLGDGEGLLLVGSVGEGLANEESDLDLLLLAQGGPDGTSDVLRAMPEGFDLNIEVVTTGHVESLCRRFRQSLDDARRTPAAQAPRMLTFVGSDELRLLHRLRTGIPLLESAATIAALRGRHALHALPDFCMLQHVACHLRLRADAAQAARDATDPHTALQMCQLATRQLIAAVLALAGETNPSPKWSLRLLRDHRQSLHGFDCDALLRLSLPGWASPAGAVVAEMTAISGRTLDQLVVAAERAHSPMAAVIRDLLPHPPAAAAYGDLACAL